METRNSLRSRFVALPVQGSMAVSIDEHRTSTIRNYASMLGLDLKRKYEVRLDKVARRYIITRTA